MIRDVDEVFNIYTVHQLCLTGRCQADNSRHSKVNSRQSGSASRTEAGHHVRHPVYISGLRPRGQQRRQEPSPTRQKRYTSHSGRSKAQRETPDHHGSHFPGSGTNVGRYKLTISTQRPGSPRTRLNTTTSQFSLPSTGDPCIIHKNGPVESECKRNNVNPHIIRNQYQIQNQIEVTLNEHRYCKWCHYHTNTEF